jgi:arginyl-tRNA synthetase
MLALGNLPDEIMKAYKQRAPNYLCDFAYNLAQSFSRFYQQCHILRESDSAVQSSWLALSRLYLQETELILDLLGISIPERM